MIHGHTYTQPHVQNKRRGKKDEYFIITNKFSIDFCMTVPLLYDNNNNIYIQRKQSTSYSSLGSLQLGYSFD